MTTTPPRKLHSWRFVSKAHGTFRTVCMNCGTMKDARAVNGFRWSEYLLAGSDNWFPSGAVPECGVTVRSRTVAQERPGKEART